MVKLGMIGLSPGNGHPFSFSSIINGFNEKEIAKTEWDTIYKYLIERDESEFGIPGSKITHVWTQDPNVTKKLSRACYINTPVLDYHEMIGEISGLIIARDDYEAHYEIAKPFLEENIPVFIDKPLSLNIEELKFFLPYLENGLLMSCSGLRYAKELDYLRSNSEIVKSSNLIRGTVTNNWEKYAIHILDAIFNVISFNVVSVIPIDSNHDSLVLRLDNNCILHINAIGPKIKIFQIDFLIEDGFITTNLLDNFSAFKRTLFHFIKMVQTNSPPIQPSLTINLMKTLLAGQRALVSNKEVYLDEINL